jgi:hypothetical protein
MEEPFPERNNTLQITERANQRCRSLLLQGSDTLSSRSASLVVLNPRLTGYWSFNNNPFDSVGRTTVWRRDACLLSGKTGCAIDLDGTNDYVTLPGGVADAVDITVAAWVNWDGGGNWQRIFDFGNNTTSIWL